MGTRQNYQRNQRKTDGAENPLHVLPAASNLIDYTLNLTDNTKHFPKKVRFTLVNRIQDHVLSIYEKLLAANEIYPIRSAEDKARRLTLQRDALTACKMLHSTLSSHVRSGGRCRPYGGEWGCSVIDKQADTQVGPYAAFCGNPESHS